MKSLFQALSLFSLVLSGYGMRVHQKPNLQTLQEVRTAHKQFVELTRNTINRNLAYTDPRNDGEKIQLLQLFGGDGCEEDDGYYVEDPTENEEPVDYNALSDCEKAIYDAAVFQEPLADIESDDLEVVDAALTEYCKMGNQNGLVTAYEHLMTTCNPEASQEEIDEGVESIIMMNNIICSESNGEFCMVVLMPLMEDDCEPTQQPVDEEAAMIEMLDQICGNSCLDELFGAFVADDDCAGEAMSSMFEVMCIKAGDQYCMLEFENLFEDEEDDGNYDQYEEDDGMDVEMIAQLCESPCFGALLSLLDTILNMEDNMDCGEDNDPYAEQDNGGDDEGIFAFDFEMMCVADYSNPLDPYYCIQMTQTMDSNDDTESCPDLEGVPQNQWTCPSTCKSGIEDIVTTFGCCTDWLLDFSQTMTGDDSMRTFARQTCQISLPDECEIPDLSVSTWTLTIEIPVPNLNCLYASDEIENGDGELVGALARDLARQLQLTRNHFSYQDIECDGDGSILIYEVTVFSEEEADDISDNIDNVVSNAHLLDLTEFLLEQGGSVNNPAFNDGDDVHAGDVEVDIEENEVDDDGQAEADGAQSQNIVVSFIFTIVFSVAVLFR